MPENIAYITPQIVTWARERAQLTLEELAEKFDRVPASLLREWEGGKSYPSVAQAENLATKLRIPFLILFKSDPPSTTLKIPDLRTVATGAISKPSINFFDVLRDALVKQRWYRSELKEEGAHPLPFVASYTMRDGVNEVANSITQLLNIDDGIRDSAKTADQFLVRLVESAEELGIIVIRNGQVRHASLRPLDVDEFRGFALSDPVAPLIFINTKDAQPARIFTFVHELAHVWIGESGVSNPDPRLDRKELPNTIERFCNAVAAQVLMPEKQFRRIWNDRAGANENINAISRAFKVSTIAAAIRARDAEKVSHGVAAKIIQAAYDRWELTRQKIEEDEKESGPTFWQTFGPRTGQLIVGAVVTRLRENRITHLDAASVLGIRLRTLDAYLSKLGVRA